MVTLPTFVIAGTQKAATTWLYECLVEHPQVSMSRTKELHFFCDADQCPKSTWTRGVDWYRTNFPGTRPDASVVGEASVDYMYYECAPERIHGLNPEMKVIFILRDPIDRAYSAYWMRRRARPSYPPFSEFVNSDSDVVRRGFYFEQIQRYRQYFPDDQLKVLIYEDIDGSAKSFLRDVFEFLEVDAAFSPDSALQLIGETKAMRPTLSTFFYRYGAKVLRLRPALTAWRLFKKLTGCKRKTASSGPKYPPMGPSDRERLDFLFRDETDRLYQFLGRRISTWSID